MSIRIYGMQKTIGLPDGLVLFRLKILQDSSSRPNIKRNLCVFFVFHNLPQTDRSYNNTIKLITTSIVNCKL